MWTLILRLRVYACLPLQICKESLFRALFIMHEVRVLRGALSPARGVLSPACGVLSPVDGDRYVRAAYRSAFARRVWPLARELRRV